MLKQGFKLFVKGAFVGGVFGAGFGAGAAMCIWAIDNHYKPRVGR